MKYLMMLFAEERFVQITPEAVGEWAAFGREASEYARLVAGDALKPTASVVSVRDGKTVVTDDPFSDTKEQLAGYTIFDCKDLDVAIKVASMIPRLNDGRVEIRPIAEFGETEA